MQPPFFSCDLSKGERNRLLLMLPVQADNDMITFLFWCRVHADNVVAHFF